MYQTLTWKAQMLMLATESLHLDTVLVFGTYAPTSGCARCYCSACVKDITLTAPQLLETHHKATATVVRVSTTGLNHRQRPNFVHLVYSLLDTGKQCIISGPAHCFGDVKVSRLRQLHV